MCADSTTKRCTRCGVDKPLSEFSPDSRYKFGVSSRCKVCKAAYKRSRRKDPRFADVIQREREQCNERRRTDEARALGRKRDKDRYHTDPEYRERVKAWSRQRGPENERRRRERYHANPEYRQRLRERGNKGNQRYRQSPKGKAGNKAHWRQWRARKVNAIGSHTAAEWELLCERYGHICLACGQRLPLTEDHVVPLVRGGTDDISNIQPLCRPCNSRKGSQTIDCRPAYEVGV